MSVIASKRKTSTLEFLHTAREIEIVTLRNCANFPKRYSFLFSQQLANSAVRVYEDVKKANSVFPTNQHEFQIRRDFLINAYAELQSMVSQVEIAQEMFGVHSDKIIPWMELISSELALIKALMKSDKARYKFP